jgi:hypothetical protein
MHTWSSDWKRVIIVIMQTDVGTCTAASIHTMTFWATSATAAAHFHIGEAHDNRLASHEERSEEDVYFSRWNNAPVNEPFDYVCYGRVTVSSTTG